ncbi:hypothetical protein [uncultured Tenacibaculum sp.]|uniref:hypothetical protein n=1 Tax=uncultured Tenacibaculum sp. TaxID=174713 RepID=UPI00262D86B3|nr:hypothetical protein [uncultured Tenacibaculum sp.]
MKINHLTTKKVLHEIFKPIVLFCFLLLTSSSIAQQKKTNSVVDSFKNYTSNYKETAYAQLNKSTYIKGETLGFSSYIINKATKTPSFLTKNLYCVITDNNNRIIKSKLLKVENGIAYNSFDIDSLFTSGVYTFKAYTNWMKNFDEPNAFIESFKVIDPTKNSTQQREQLSNTIDAQFLPEGGHLIYNVKTNVGVTIKDNRGYGLSNIEGKVFNHKDSLITAFKTNFLGIGNFLLLPKTKEYYTVKFNYLDKEYNSPLTNVKDKGISINLNQSNTKIIVELNTNEETLKEIKNEPFKLVIHNGDSIKEGAVKFESTNFVKVIDQKKLLSGINIFTLFDKNNNPILERLLFNYNGIHTISLKKSKAAKKGDSLLVTIPFANATNFQKEDIHLSLSVLPKGTKSYQKNHNIISHTYLQPYVKGYIENGGYYFTDVDREKKHHLDNLLITQGWSSYDWNAIFQSDTPNKYIFENGIIIKVNKNSDFDSDFFIHPLKNGNPSIIRLEEDENYLVKEGLYPLGEEPLNLSSLDRTGKLVKPNLYLQFHPRKAPDFNEFPNLILSPKSLFYSYESKVKPFTKLELNQQQELDEVTIKGNLRKKKFQEIKRDGFSKVYGTKKSVNDSFLSLAQYINAYVTSFGAREELGRFSISGPFKEPPLVYLDDIPLARNDLLFNFSMNQVDYIVTNPRGYGEGLRGSYGSIKIYTKTVSDFAITIENNREFKFPLSFSKNKKFYVPKYHTYDSSFYQEYGVIDWIPNATLDAHGNISFTIHNPANTNITIFIEGITQNGKYIAATKVLNFNKTP